MISQRLLKLNLKTLMFYLFPLALSFMFLDSWGGVFNNVLFLVTDVCSLRVICYYYFSPPHPHQFLRTVPHITFVLHELGHSVLMISIFFSKSIQFCYLTLYTTFSPVSFHFFLFFLEAWFIFSICL